MKRSLVLFPLIRLVGGLEDHRLLYQRHPFKYNRDHLRSAGCSQWSTNASSCGGAVPECDFETTQNVILLHEPAHSGAGLGDREAVIVGLGTLAEALCAQLWIPPPYMMLGTLHNNLHGMSCSWRWDRYYEFVAGSQGLIKEWEIGSRCVDKYKRLKIVEAYANKTRNYVTDLNQAFGAYTRGENFLFTVATGDFFTGVAASSCKYVLQQLRSQGCHRANKCPYSSVALAAAQSVVKGIDEYSILHLRRGDTITRGCNTTIERVKMFMNCHLSDHKRASTALIIFTDETDAAYLIDLVLALETLSPRVILGDSAAIEWLVRHGARDIDNYLVYLVSEIIKKHALEHHHSTVLEYGGYRAHGAASVTEYCDNQVICEQNRNINFASEPKST